MIATQRFFLKPITIDDVNYIYLSWLNQKTNAYIEYAKSHSSMEELKRYVSERENRQDVLFLGIFTKEAQHIGNIKYEPIDHKNKSAVMGILIGNNNWRGKGVATEVIKASGHYLAVQYGIETIILGVYDSNKAAVSAYKKVGFKVKEQNQNRIKMTWKL
ncbi:GNAT family N-acetyltransferase [Alphaproteobacteria bacterium]|nr:GNAT family N-acetyltransferase [Alphaproteobacteria bacterium]